MSLVSGKLMVIHEISEPNGPPGPGCTIWFYVHGRKDKILVDQSLIIEYDGSKSVLKSVEKQLKHIHVNCLKIYQQQVQQNLSFLCIFSIVVVKRL